MKRVRKVKSLAEQVIDKNTKPPRPKPQVEFISSGSWTLNLALTGQIDKGFPLGKIINIVGDKSSGKTLVTLECIATEYHKNKNLEIDYIDAEADMNFDTETLYKFKLEPIFLDTIEKWKKHLIGKINNNKKELISILDSLDNIDSENEGEKGYHLERIKTLNQFFRQAKSGLKKKQGLLIIISQVRENIGVTFGKKLKRNGGKALGHNSSQEIWLAECKKIKKGDDVIGITVKAKVEKNKVWRAWREVFIDILYDYGIDNISSGVDYLFDLKDKQTGKCKKTGEFVFNNIEFKKRSSLISYIEENKLDDLLKTEMQKKCDIKEEDLTPNRRSKF
jgi:recombination protein RecA